MRKILFVALGAILGGLAVGGANASIISRGFLNETLTKYALKTETEGLSTLQNTYKLYDNIDGLFYNSFSMGGYMPANLTVSEYIYQSATNAQFPGLYGVAMLLLNGFSNDNGADNLRYDGIFGLNNSIKTITNKMGQLPSGYSTVGMALSAMDAKIVAKDLPADSDDGQYVLSAKKVGGTITYTWVKMDLTDAEK